MHHVVIRMEKQQIREEVWALLEKEHVARFPMPILGRIPNFAGADFAAMRLRKLVPWRNATSIKCNPDSPQKYVRLLALNEGKTIYMAVPRLRKKNCFIELDPNKVTNPEKAVTIKGAFKYGVEVHPSQMKKIDLMVVGSVAVSEDGAKVGKGGGFSDLEFAIGQEFEILDDTTPIVTTVHPLQIVDYQIPMTKHDVPIDYIVTHEKILETNTNYARPKGVIWDDLDNQKINDIPILQELWERHRVEQKKKRGGLGETLFPRSRLGR